MMAKRFVSIWFRYIATDWYTLRQSELRNTAFVLSAPSNGRMIVTAANALAEAQGVYSGIVLADARAIIPGLHVVEDKPGLTSALLNRIAEWCIRFAPFAAVDLPDSLVLNVSGCSHLWGGDEPYLKDIVYRLKARGYHVRAAIADTVGTAWAVARFGKGSNIISKGRNIEALLHLPPAALRIETNTIDRLHTLGLRQIKDFISMPRSTLRRRFGIQIIERLNQALGHKEEIIQPVQPIEPYHERLPCLEPIVTATGIEMALQRLLKALCQRLQQEQKGLRTACFKSYRVDGKIEQVDIATNRPSCNVNHLFKLFEIKIPTIEPDLGIELFILEAPKVEDHAASQEKLWEARGGLDDIRLSELIDRLTGKIGSNSIHRFVPDEHYLPERSIKAASSLNEKVTAEWKLERPRPIQLLPIPEHIDVMAIIPDNPPIHFRYKGKMHKVAKADGPERIEQEWWIEEGQHRDYYAVEDEQGCRYWVFRLGHYDEEYEWFIHGFFA